MRSLWSSIILLATLFHAFRRSLAAHIDFPRRSAAPLPNLFARAGNGASSLNFFNNGYFINITLGGQQFSVLIDTGSSDLWVAGTVPNAVDTGVTAGVQYAVGSDSGPVKTAPLNILGYTVPNQAFIEVTPSDQSPVGLGLIGLGPSSSSQIFATLNGSPGDPPLDNLFRLDTSIPNFITVLLNRLNDTAEQYTGEFTISEILPQFQNVSSQTKVPVTVLQSSISGDQHFSLLLDSDGVIGPDGNAIKITSNASAAPTHNQNQLQVVLDTGFSLPQFPEYIVDAIYSGISGAHKENLTAFDGEVWVLDCKSEVNASIKIGGQTYPIHPLDLSQKGVDDSGNEICYGTFQPVIAGAHDPTFDAILGMTVLSNMYVLLDYGDFIDGSTSNTAAPYVQLLPTTDPAAAHADFVATRLGGVDTTGSQQHAGSTTNPGSSSSGGGGFFQKYKIPIFVGVAVAGLAVFLLAVWLVTRQRKPSYRPLFDPAPRGDFQMHHVSGYNNGPQPQYADPWSHRR